MSETLLGEIQMAQAELDPAFKALRRATGALRQAAKLAGEERLDALAMQKVLVKLEAAAADLDSPVMNSAVSTFAKSTQEGLNGLAFEFAHDLREAFQERGLDVEGRPPTLVVGELVLNIDIAARKAQWLYGKEALTRLIPLSINGILKAYDAQYKNIIGRDTDTEKFLNEIYVAWDQLISERNRRPAGGRIGIIDVYSKVVLNRQNTRFWNQPSRSTFRDYDRAHFVRDLVLALPNPRVTVDGETHRLRLGVATKSQADSASRSVWLPADALDGEYYSDVTFEE